jgi:hypothetical protein
MNAFKLLKVDNVLTIQPRAPGLYRVEFHTWILANEASSLGFWLYKHPGNYHYAYIRQDAPKGQTISFTMTRYVRMTASDSVYVNVRQFDPQGNARVWIGSNDEHEARAWSGLYVVKV